MESHSAAKRIIDRKAFRLDTTGFNIDNGYLRFASEIRGIDGHIHQIRPNP